MKLPDSFISRQLRDRDLCAALHRLETDADFKFFLSWLLDECSVTKPRFSKDPMEIIWYESKRHLAMSVLLKLGRATPSELINEIENTDSHA